MANFEDNTGPNLALNLTWYWCHNLESIVPLLQSQYRGGYIKTDNTRFWDGYQSQEVVMWLNFNGKYPFRLLMHLMDRYPLRVEVRRSSRIFTTKQIILVSRNRPESYYLDPHQTLENRLREFTTMIEVTK